MRKDHIFVTQKEEKYKLSQITQKILYEETLLKIDIDHHSQHKWVQKLEKLNSSPRISKKVNGTDREKIRRGNISKFKDYIDLENPTRRCFISNDILNNDELSIDHVIPWSFLYSDDLLFD